MCGGPSEYPVADLGFPDPGRQPQICWRQSFNWPHFPQKTGWKWKKLGEVYVRGAPLNPPMDESSVVILRFVLTVQELYQHISPC